MGGQIWPLFDLEVVTPRIVLRYVTDELGATLATLAAKGIHDPATMPFSEPWTDVPRWSSSATACGTTGATAPRHPSNGGTSTWR